MKERTTILKILILSAFTLTTSILFSANEVTKRVNSEFIIKQGTIFKIKKSTQIVLTSNLLLESDILGKGKLVMNAKQNSFINAKKHKIQNLVLSSPKKVELRSNLTIVQSLEIIQADLVLNDFMLIVNDFTELSSNLRKRITNNGAGRLIIKSDHNFPIAIAPTFVNSYNCIYSKGMNTIDFIRNSIPYNKPCYLTRIQDRAVKVAIPPPKDFS